MFDAPEKRSYSDGSVYYFLALKTPIVLETPLTWSRTALKEDIAVQSEVMEVRATVLQAIAQNRSLFAKPPTEKSLLAMASKWGLLLSRSGECSWSDANVWQSIPDVLSGKEAEVHLKLSGIHISPASIRPVWSMEVVSLLPETPVIEFDFQISEDVQSVHSADIEGEDSEVMQLTNMAAEKRESKQRVRELIAKAQEARQMAEDAVERFLEEYDLSDEESDFSDMDA
jgi:hypothetical protein